MERPECEPPPTATRSVSPAISRTRSGSTPSHSAMSWGNAVSWPWPAERVPMITSMKPSGCAVTCARSRGAPVAISM